MKNKEILVLVTGAHGLLGRYIVNELRASKLIFYAYGKEELDISNVQATNAIIERINPDFVINCAAYTDVVKAEIEKGLTYAVNVEGVINLVDVSNRISAKLIHISTDYVFDGKSKSGLYYPNSKKNPINYYGLTKHLAEEHIISNCLKYVIIRTSWLYGRSETNFVKKIINLSQLHETINLNYYEYGSPTYALDLARSIIRIIRQEHNGIFHYSNIGFVSRYEFARRIIELSGYNLKIKHNLNLLNKVLRPKAVKLLNNYKYDFLFDNRDWHDALKEFINSEKEF